MAAMVDTATEEQTELYLPSPLRCSALMAMNEHFKGAPVYSECRRQAQLT